MKTILIVEDATKIAKNIQTYLTNRGYKTFIAETGEEGILYAKENVFDLAIVDVMLPGIDGYGVCDYILQNTESGVIMATAQGSSTQKIQGLDAGADDYIAKPFELAELEARIRSVLRRLQPVETIEIGNVVIDMGKRCARLSGSEVDLTTKQWNLLQYLSKNQGIYMSRTELIEYMRGEDLFSGDEKLDVYINVLRKKLGSKLIETRRGFGYRLVTSLHGDE